MPTNSESKAYIVFLIFPLLISLCEIAGLSIGQSAMEDYEIDHRGMMTEGRAIIAGFERAGRGGGAYFVRYIFHYKDIRYSGHFKTTEAWVKDTRLPTTIRVQFLPEKPDVNWPPDVGVRTPMLVKIIFLLLAFVGGLYLAGKVFSAWHRSGNRWSPLAMGLIVSSWVFTGLCVFGVVPMLTVMLGMGCVVVAAGLGMMERAPSTNFESQQIHPGRTNV